MQPVLESDRLGCKLEGNDAVCSYEGITIFEVNLVLAVSNFVVGGFNLKSHITQCKDNITSDVFCRVGWSEIEISSVIFEFCCRYTIIHFKQEKFEFRSGIKCKTHLCRFGNGFTQDKPGITIKRFIPVRLDITDEPGNLSFLGSPGKDSIRCQVRLEHHVGLFNPGKSFDGGSIEPDTLGQCFLCLNNRDRDVFRLTLDVSELKADEFYFIRLDFFQEFGYIC